MASRVVADGPVYSMTLTPDEYARLRGNGACSYAVEQQRIANGIRQIYTKSVHQTTTEMSDDDTATLPVRFTMGDAALASPYARIDFALESHTEAVQLSAQRFLVGYVLMPSSSTSHKNHCLYALGEHQANDAGDLVLPIAATNANKGNAPSKAWRLSVSLQSLLSHRHAAQPWTTADNSRTWHEPLASSLSSADAPPPPQQQQQLVRRASSASMAAAQPKRWMFTAPSPPTTHVKMTDMRRLIGVRITALRSRGEIDAPYTGVDDAEQATVTMMLLAAVLHKQPFVDALLDMEHVLAMTLLNSTQRADEQRQRQRAFVADRMAAAPHVVVADEVYALFDWVRRELMYGINRSSSISRSSSNAGDTASTTETAAMKT